MTQDWTEYATDQSQCGPVLVKRGAVKRTEVAVRRCQISFDMEAALKGSKARVNVDGLGDTVGYVDTADPSESLCTGTQAPAIFQWGRIPPIGRCGSSGFCATAGDQLRDRGLAVGARSLASPNGTSRLSLTLPSSTIGRTRFRLRQSRIFRRTFPVLYRAGSRLAISISRTRSTAP
jgi:hypothetical protein